MLIEQIKNLRTGHTIALTQNINKWQVVKTAGTNPPTATINRANVVGGHGSTYKSSRIGDRQLVITLDVHGNVEQNLLELYEVISTNENVEFYYRTSRVNVKINGWVSNITIDRNSSPIYLQITIDCPRPFFKGVDEIIEDWASVEDYLEFVYDEIDGVGYMQIDQTYSSNTYTGGLEFTTMEFNSSSVIYNAGQVEVGMIIEFDCLDAVSSLKIENTLDTNEYFGINHNFQAGDIIIINTNFGEEEVYLMRGNQKINLINYMLSNCSWLQLKVGNNYLDYVGGGAGATDVKIRYATEYEGV